jgi:hypothetical protein
MRQGIKIIGAWPSLAAGLQAATVTEQSLRRFRASRNRLQIRHRRGFDPFAGAPGTAAAPPTQPAVRQGQAQGPAAQTQAALPAGQVRGQIRFMPVIGAPVNAVTPLSRQLAVEARNRGLAILSASDPGGEHVLKGYFSADSFDGQTTVYYVWDVLDPSGTRLTRIQGQESFPGGSGDPWASVPAKCDGKDRHPLDVGLHCVARAMTTLGMYPAVAVCRLCARSFNRKITAAWRCVLAIIKSPAKTRANGLAPRPHA